MTLTGDLEASVEDESTVASLEHSQGSREIEITKYANSPKTVFFIKEMSYAQFGGVKIDEGCGSLVYAPSFYPGTLLDGLVSRPVDDADFLTNKGLKFIIDASSLD